MAHESSFPDSQTLPVTSKRGSVLRRALFGLVVLFFGTFGAAWLFHASISATPTAEAGTSTLTASDSVGAYATAKRIAHKNTQSSQ